MDNDPVMDEREERFGKRDRLARMLRVVSVLRGHPEGIRPAEIARRTGVATRTVYRDLRALEEEVGVAVWSGRGTSNDGAPRRVRKFHVPAQRLVLSREARPTISPDGEKIAFVAGDSLWIQELDQLDPRQLAPFDGLLRFPAEGMLQAGGVAEPAAEERQHRFHHLRVAGRGGVGIEVEARHGNA